MSDATLQKLKDRLGIASPAKKGIEVGKFLDMGIAIGIVRFGKNVFEAITDLGSGVEDQMYASFEQKLDADYSPVITPELDLSLVDRGLSDLNSKFASSNGISLQGSRLASAFSSISNKELRDMELASRINSEPKQIVNNLTQNNYSPKSLSRIDIYRQTKNQFSRLKTEMEGA